MMKSLLCPTFTVDCCLFRQGVPMELRNIIHFYGFEELNDSNIRDAVYDWRNRNQTALMEYGHISNWRTTKVTNMFGLFYGSRCSDSIEDWDTSNVTNMTSMFQRCDKYNQSLNNWDVRNVTTIERLFADLIRSINH